MPVACIGPPTRVLDTLFAHETGGRAPPVHHRDAADEEFAEFASAEAAPVAAKPVEAAPAEAKPVEAVPAVPRSAATNVLVRLCTS